MATSINNLFWCTSPLFYVVPQGLVAPPINYLNQNNTIVPPAPPIVVVPVGPWLPPWPLPSAIAPARDFGFSHASGKFLLTGGGFIFTSGREGVRQAIEIELRTLQGEWFLAFLCSSEFS
jgi:hypothetical protein